MEKETHLEVSDLQYLQQEHVRIVVSDHINASGTLAYVQPLEGLASPKWPARDLLPKPHQNAPGCQCPRYPPDTPLFLSFQSLSGPGWRFLSCLATVAGQSSVIRCDRKTCLTAPGIAWKVSTEEVAASFGCDGALQGAREGDGRKTRLGHLGGEGR